jgi:adenosylcobinamide-phosphate synthase
VPRRRDGAALAGGLVAAVVADALLADPRRGHPVAGFGLVAGRLERALWRPSRAAGVGYVAALVTPPTVLARAVDRRGTAGRRAAVVAATGWMVLGSASLAREAAALRRALAGGDPAGGDPAGGDPLGAARGRLPHLCGRDPAVLDRVGLIRATIESVAENTSDAAVAPLVWGALAGPAGLVAYRAVNTLDAMVGHRSERHRDFGWAAARLDDLANVVPARLTAALATVLAPAVGGRPAAAWRAWRRDAPAHPSPNAGPCEAAFAGALGVRLGGPTTYSYGTSQRPWLGTGRAPVTADIDRAVRLSRLVTWSAAALCAAAALRRRAGAAR